jgi:hypothetical protein
MTEAMETRSYRELISEATRFSIQHGFDVLSEMHVLYCLCGKGHGAPSLICKRFGLTQSKLQVPVTSEKLVGLDYLHVIVPQVKAKFCAGRPVEILTVDATFMTIIEGWWFRQLAERIDFPAEHFVRESSLLLGFGDRQSS